MQNGEKMKEFRILLTLNKEEGNLNVSPYIIESVSVRMQWYGNQYEKNT